MSDTSEISSIELAELTMTVLEQKDSEPRESLAYKGGPTQQVDCARRIRELRLELEALDADIKSLAKQNKLDEAEELQKRVDAVRSRFAKLKNKGMEENI